MLHQVLEDLRTLSTVMSCRQQYTFFHKYYVFFECDTIWRESNNWVIADVFFDLENILQVSRLSMLLQ